MKLISKNSPATVIYTIEFSQEELNDIVASYGVAPGVGVDSILDRYHKSRGTVSRSVMYKNLQEIAGWISGR